MSRKLLALAAALAASIAVTSAAEAGGGVRLGFGGPLGTFVATPATGGGGGYQKQHADPKKRTSPVREAKRYDRPAPRATKTETKKTVAAKQDPGVASKAESVAGESAARVTGNSALIQGSIPADRTETLAPAADVSAEAPSTSNTVTAATDTASDASGNCRKFIPAIGTTVSVGCNDETGQ
jgi:hypothetical protein